MSGECSPNLSGTSNELETMTWQGTARGLRKCKNMFEKEKI